MENEIIITTAEAIRAELGEKLDAIKAARAALESAISDYNNTAGTAFERLYSHDIGSRCDIKAARR